MSLKYSLIWFLSGVILLICAIFPQVIRFFTQLMGVYSEANAVFFIGVCFLILIGLSLTSIASGQSERIRTLAVSYTHLEIYMDRFFKIYFIHGNNLPSLISVCDVFGSHACHAKPYLFHIIARLIDITTNLRNLYAMPIDFMRHL